MYALLAALVCSGAVGYSDDVVTHRFQGDSLPAAPQQAAPWTPPKTRLSSRLVAATRTLFAQGLSDPRGCEYREFVRDEARLYSQTSAESAEEPVHGWLLPANPTRSQRFAIGRDGLIYPVSKVGARADLRADVDKACEKGYCTPLDLCFLLRLGEASLSESCFDAIATDKNRDELCDPYLLIARQWTESLMGRAVAAHKCGDDRMALVAARALSRIWDAAEAEAKALNIHVLRANGDFAYANYLNQNPGEPFYNLEQLQPIRAILADQERRAAERKNGSCPPFHCEEITSVSAPDTGFWRQVESKLGHKLDSHGRIALLIQWFEECSESDGDLAQRLRPYRDEAIEPLLSCLVNDKRLTRNFTRTEVIEMEPVPVSEVAFSALRSLLDEKIEYVSVSERSAEGLKALAEDIRGHWKKEHNSSPRK
jgi:hypothetical protein